MTRKWPVIVAFLIFTLSLHAEQTELPDGYGMFLKAELDGKEYRALLRKANSEQAFKKAIEILNNRNLVTNYRAKDTGHEFKIAHPDNDAALVELKKTTSVMGAYIGSEVIARVYQNRNKKINREYGIAFAKRLYENGVCEGYLYYGDMLKDTLDEEEKAKRIWKEAMDKGCTGRDWLKWTIKARYYR